MVIDHHMPPLPRCWLCWIRRWPNDLIHFPQAAQDNISSLLFSEDGLHLSSYRYNLGGDGDYILFTIGKGAHESLFRWQ